VVVGHQLGGDRAALTTPCTAERSRGWSGDADVGGQPAMSVQDAEIVRRIRERCPDSRCDGGSDDELLQLFQRNNRVVNRADDDVIAAIPRRALQRRFGLIHLAALS
jgi:hypothetical protein